MVATLLLAGCAAVPLTTMWKMRDFTLDAFFAKDPRDLRVAIRTDDRMRRGSANPTIDIRVDGVSTKPICYAFALIPVTANDPPLEAAPSDRRWYPFALSKSGLEAFERARREVRTAGTGHADIALAVGMNDVLDFPEGRTSLPIRIDLALDRKDGYFPLLKESTVEAGTHTTTVGDGRRDRKDASESDPKNPKQPCPVAAG